MRIKPSTHDIGISCICGHRYFAKPSKGRVTCPQCNHIWNLLSSSYEADPLAANENNRLLCEKAKANMPNSVNISHPENN